MSVLNIYRKIVFGLIFFNLSWTVSIFAFDIITQGDSITQGLQRRADLSVFGITAPVNGAADIGGYQSRVNARLNAVNKPSTLYNWGIGGENSAQGLGRINAVINTRPNADFILLMYGANDLYQGISAGANRANITSMINISRSRGIVPIIAEITPNFDFGNAIPASYNPGIAAAASATGTTLAPMHSVLAPGWFSVPYNSGDRLHLSNAGYDRMAEVWFNIINAKTATVAPPPPPPPPEPEPDITPIINLLLSS